MSNQINGCVKWVGQNDWELRKFHGEELSTHRGSTYNSYLIQDEKIVLMDTVWKPYASEFISKLKKEVNLSDIDYIVIHHAEIDHSGALGLLMREIPDTPIYCTANGIKSIKGQFHEDWNFVTVKTGDKINLGKNDLVFIEAPMLHWPDTMFSYLTEEKTLFTTDGFGQHFCSGKFFNNEVNQSELFEECLKYYANILTPFNKQVKSKINEILKLNVPVKMICPSHGIIWKRDPLEIVDKYLEWADNYKEDQVTVIYDSMWDNTKKMAEIIGDGVREIDPRTTVKLFNVAKADKNDVITEIFKSKGIIVGSPTINNGISTGMAAILEEIKGLRFKGKTGAAFGSYGWSGESPKVINKELTTAGFEMIIDDLKVLWTPDEDAMTKCFEFGETFGRLNIFPEDET